MKTWKRSLCLLMAALLLAALPAAALAAPEAATGTDAPQSMEEELIFRGEVSLLEEGTTDLPAAADNRMRGVSAYSEEYYGDQLPEASRAVYDAIKGSPLWNGPAEHMIELTDYLPEEAKMLPGTVTVTNEDGTFLLTGILDDEKAVQDMVAAAHTALLYDHPELSWLVNTDPAITFVASAAPTEEEMEVIGDLQPGDVYTLGTHTVELKSLRYGMSSESVRRATTAPEAVTGPERWQYAGTGDRAAIEAVLEKAWAEIGDLNGRTDAEKVQAVHDWVCGHVRYADRTSGRFTGSWRGYQTVWSAMAEGESVCAGYAKSVKLLLDSYGIPCVIVRGESRGESHAWNCVMLNGSWYGLDATWADQDWGIDRRDFLRGDSGFGQDHSAGSLADSFAFVCPVLAQEDYQEGSTSVLPGDVNLDGTVNLRDLPALADALQAVRPLSPQALANGDLNGTGGIEIEDVVLLAEMLRKNGYAQGAQAGNAPAVQIAAEKDALQPGDMVSVTISGTGAGICGRLESSGLEFAGVSSGMSDEGTFVLMPDYGTPAVTYTYRVSAEAGSVSLQASQICRTDGSILQQAAGASWSGEVIPSSETPAPVPALEIPAVSGYEGGMANNRTYYAKNNAASTKYYLRSGSGKMTRVAAPGVKASGQTFYPVSIGGNVLFPRIENGKVTCYCTYQDGMEIPVLNAAAEASPELTGGYQTGEMNGRPYYVKVSGAGMKFYLKSSSGKMTRVAAPSISAGGAKYYPINHGGTVLWPVVQGGKLTGYSAWAAGQEIPVLIPVGL